MREEFDRVFDVYWPVGLAVFAVVTALVGYAVLRFRSSERELPRGRDTRPRVEIAYAAAIGGIVAVLLTLTYGAMSDIDTAEDEAAAAGGPLVEITAAKWSWRFDYPRHGISQTGSDHRPATLVVPVDTPVRFRQTSTDVIHSFWVPSLRFKRDAIPDRTTTFALTFPDEGFMAEEGRCNQFCGLLHSTMTFNVNVLGRDEFRRWVRNSSAAANAESPAGAG